MILAIACTTTRGEPADLARETTRRAEIPAAIVPASPANVPGCRRLLATALAILFASLVAGMTGPACRAQDLLPGPKFGEVVPRDVREMYDHGLQYLASKQTDKGEWSGGGYEEGPGPVGLSLLAFLASGEDPNFGQYSNHVRRSVRWLIKSQDSSTGIMGDSMYHHGFAMLALAEAYGAVDERTLWPDGKGPRTIGQALELAVRAAVTSQKKNSLGGWRYSPDASDADTSVSGAVLVGLLAARNAGIEIPDQAIDKALAFYKQMTAPSGQVAYTGGIGGFDESIARISIASLVYAVGRRKELPEYKATADYLKQRLEQQITHQWPEYARYYQAQALFQADLNAWEKWNKLLVRQLKAAQKPDGSFQGQLGPTLSTSFSLLALALNYRFLPIYER